MDAKDKIVVITGGAGGLGTCFSRELLKRGVKTKNFVFKFIAIFELSNSKTKKVFKNLEKEAGGRIGFYETDVTNTAQFKENLDKVIEEHQTIDLLINNAGIVTDNKPELMIDVNFKAVVMGTLAMIERFGKHKGGKGATVINVASIAGLLNGPLPIYYSTKHAIVSFTRILEEQVNLTEVRVMALCPGLTDTQILLDVSQTLDFIDIEGKVETYVMQRPENVSTALPVLIEKGKSGEIWISENDLPPYRVRDVDHYSKYRID